MKNKMFNWLKPRNWGIVKVYRDFENYLDWRRVIKREKFNKNSNYNKWKLSHTKLYDIYTIVSLDEADEQLPEKIKKIKVMEMLNPLNRYLDEDLGFAECLNIEFNQIEDENKKLTLSHLIVYRFRFEKFSLLWIIKFIIFLTSIVLIIKFNVIPYIIAWVTNLI